MSTKTFSKWLIKVAVVALLAVPSVAQAQADPLSLWMATSSNQSALAGSEFGRLTVANGVLAFRSPRYDWQLPLAEVKRISSSKLVANAFEIESVTGEVFFVGILDGQLNRTSHGKAVQAIQRAVRTAPVPAAPIRTTLVAAGGGIQ